MFSMSWLDADTLFPAKGRTFAASRICFKVFRTSPLASLGAKKKCCQVINQPVGGASAGDWGPDFL